MISQQTSELLTQINSYCGTNKTEANFPVRNPATGEEITAVPECTADITRASIKRAKAAQPDWAALTAQQRANILKKWHALILQNQDALGELLTLEQGKPIAEAKGEIGFGASFIEWFAEEGKRAYGDIIPPNMPDKRLLVIKQPIGVVGAITPWNFPNAMITRKVAPALAAGCSIILKPSEDTPLSAIALRILASDAGIPEDVFQIVTSSHGAEIGEVLTTHEDIRKISFTGSTQVGKLLMRQSADTLKKLSLELGGNAPFIVFNDADIDGAVSAAMISKFRNSGQTCVCANRILVQSGVYETFVEKFKSAIAKLQIGNGLLTETSLGPVINQKAFEKVSRLIKDAEDKGAEVTRLHTSLPVGNFIAPTMISNVTDDMDISSEEIFGPVAPIFSFETEEEAITIANSTQYGLASYFWTKDLARAWRVSEKLETGMVGLNQGLISSEAAPFGGIKESGMGREGSKYGLDDYLEIKYISMGGIA